MAVGGSPSAPLTVIKPLYPCKVHIHAGPIPARPTVAVAGHTDVNQPRIDRAEHFVAEIEPVHHSRAEILNHDVRHRG